MPIRLPIPMRQLSAPTNLLLACLAGLGLLGTLTTPWFGPPHATPKADLTQVAVGDGDGPMQHFAQWVGRVFSATGVTYTGNDALAGSKSLLFALVGLLVVLSAAIMVPALRGALRDVLRAVALASPLLIAVLVLRHPGQQHVELRWGAVAALGLGLFMASCAWHGSEFRAKRTAARVGVA
jgi:hypothetical protein